MQLESRNPFGIEKCAMLIRKRWDIEEAEGRELTHEERLIEEKEK